MSSFQLHLNPGNLKSSCERLGGYRLPSVEPASWTFFVEEGRPCTLFSGWRQGIQTDVSLQVSNSIFSVAHVKIIQLWKVFITRYSFQRLGFHRNCQRRIQSQNFQIFQDMIQGICPWKTVNKLDTYNPFESFISCKVIFKWAALGFKTSVYLKSFLIELKISPQANRGTVVWWMNLATEVFVSTCITRCCWGSSSPAKKNRRSKSSLRQRS